MKKPLVYLACDQLHREEVETLVQRLGLKAEGFDKMPALLSTARRRRPDIVLFDADIMRSGMGRMDVDLFNDGETLIVFLGEEGIVIPFPHVRLDYPLNSLDLHELLRDRVKNYSRLHVRIETALPGLFARQKDCQFCEIVNLSAGGAFIKTGTPVGAEGEEFRLYIPLLGMKRELELHSEIVFQVTPNEGNNYQQGAGVRFRQADAETTRQLEDFLRRTAGDEALPALFVGSFSRDGGSDDKPPTSSGTSRPRRVSISH